MKLFVSPHNDDAVLFGAFTLLRERPVVLTVYDSFVQPSRGIAGCDLMTRRNEDLAAVRDTLECPIQFGGLNDIQLIKGAVLVALSKFRDATEVWLPAIEKNGHDQHNLVGEIGAMVFEKAKIHRYLTYTRGGGKTKSKNEVPIRDGKWIALKLKALACYESQHQLDCRLGCWPWFTGDLNEYYA